MGAMTESCQNKDEQDDSDVSADTDDSDASADTDCTDDNDSDISEKSDYDMEDVHLQLLLQSHYELVKAVCRRRNSS